MTGIPLLLALCAAAQGCFPPTRREIETGRGLAGALLLQGALAGRLELYTDRVRVTGPGGTGDAALDEALARIGRASRQRGPAHWVERLGPWALARLHPGPALRASGTAPGLALRQVREAVREPTAERLPAVAAGALLTASGLHAVGWPGLTAAGAEQRTAGAVASLGATGTLVARASAAVADSRASSAAALAFFG
ncbi:GPP34 family phosphoprotein [Streptomyces sp. NPDC059452]|uniref:GPP34 family phosphoprotein n=1 Tax=Streptomyces sp. NPDC059452 TaxID=3346835 RepID=UPI0036C75682